MKKVFGQTVRDIKREVNKKVLKVPGIEQKVLDATSNEAWGPHGTLLADIAQASRNYHDYQKMMAVIWKRINDTGKNWRHVYKALTVLEYLVANGSERVIDDIREHAHQISTLSDFQYVDSSGKDQGHNVRRKSQCLVALVSDKELIAEVRQKAAGNREKFRNSPGAGGMNRPGGHGDRYDDNRYDGRYGSKDDYGYGRERDMEYRADARNGRNADSQSHDGDRYSMEHEGRNGRDGSGDDDYRAGSQNSDDYRYGSGGRSSDTGRDHLRDDDGQHSSRGSVGRADDSSQGGGGIGQKFSEENTGAPPSYEEAVSESRSPQCSERDGENQSTSVPRSSSPPISNGASPPYDAPGLSAPSTGNQKQKFEAFDEFDPRGSVKAGPSTSNTEMDLLGSFSDPFSSNLLAIMPATATTTAPELHAPADTVSGPTFGAAPAAVSVTEQPFDDPFGGSPFKAIPPSDSVPVQPQNTAPAPSFQANMDQNANNLQVDGPAAVVPDFDFGNSLSGLNYAPPDSQFSSHDFSNPGEEIDILAGILPPTGPVPASVSQTPFTAPGGQPAHSSDNYYGDFGSQERNLSSPFSAPSDQPAHSSDSFYGDHSSQAGNPSSAFPAQSVPPAQSSDIYGGYSSPAGNLSSPFPTQGIPPAHSSDNFYGDVSSQARNPSSALSALTGQPANNYQDFGPHAGLGTPATSQMSSQAHNGTQFNQGSFQLQSGTSPSPFSIPSGQNPHSNRNVYGEFGSHAGSGHAVGSQMLPQAQNGTAMQFIQGNLQNQAGTPPPFSASSGQLPHSNPAGTQHSPFLPLTGQSPHSNPNAATPQSPFLPPSGQLAHSNPSMYEDIGPQAGPGASQISQAPNGSFHPQPGPLATHIVASQSQNSQAMQPINGTVFPQYNSTAPPASQLIGGSFQSPGVSAAGYSSHMGPQATNGSAGQSSGSDFLQQQGQQAPFGNKDMLGDFLPQAGQRPPVTSQPTASSSSGPLALVPQASKQKFETKSTVWADTLSRGLVDLNISGPKTNPLADIGVDFDSMNRKEKRMEKQSPAPVVSAITMGKAMGSGTGMGKAGASSLRPSPNLMVSSGMGMGMRMGMGMGGSHSSGMGMGMGMGHNSGMGTGGGYGSMNQQPMGMGINQGYNMGVGMNQGYNVSMGMGNGMGMNMGMGQGNPMQHPGGPTMPGAYNPMMGGYPQQPYGGGGYR